MAQGKDHIVAGMVIWLISLFLFQIYIASFTHFMILLFCAVAGALFLDINIKSKGQRFFFSLMLPLYIFLCMHERYVLCGSLVFVALLPTFVAHRGIFHQLWFILAIACVSTITIANTFPAYDEFIKIGTLVFIFGALSHLLLDFGFSGILRTK